MLGSRNEKALVFFCFCLVLMFFSINLVNIVSIALFTFSFLPSISLSLLSFLPWPCSQSSKYWGTLGTLGVLLQTKITFFISPVRLCCAEACCTFSTPCPAFHSELGSIFAVTAPPKWLCRHYKNFALMHMHGAHKGQVPSWSFPVFPWPAALVTTTRHCTLCSPHILFYFVT